jgi:hypothetical protein
MAGVAQREPKIFYRPRASALLRSTQAVQGDGVVAHIRNRSRRNPPGPTEPPRTIPGARQARISELVGTAQILATRAKIAEREP